MSAALIGILTANWQAIAAVFAAIGGALGLYLKGRRDMAQKAELKDQTNANLIRKAGQDARDRAAADAAARGLRADDGHRRD